MPIISNSTGGGTTTESDPIFNASPAKNITSEHITLLGNTSGTNTGDQDLSPLLPKSGGALTGQLSPTTTSQVRNIALVSSEPVVGDMVEGTIYFVYEDV